jgi:hypothetical protein
MSATASIRLLLPGLLGPVADPAAVAPIADTLPALERLLARARLCGGAVADGEGGACAAFGLEGPPWPVAPVARLGEPDRPQADPAGWWLRVDPVHLRVDMNHARLFGPRALDLTATQAEGLVRLLNEHLAADGLRIDAPVPTHWYLRLDHAPDLVTYPLPLVSGRNVQPFLPGSDDAARWRGWLTEIQMLLHDAAPNTEREAAGQLPVNSLWPWGGGAQPHGAGAPAAVFGDDALTSGLARLAGAPIPESLDEGGQAREWPAGESLVVDYRAREPLVHGEIAEWLDAVAMLERAWLAPVLEALRAGLVRRLVLEPGDGRRFVLTRAGLLRVWRRRRAWHEWLAREGA